MSVKERSLVLPSESHPDPRIYVKYEDDTSEYIDGFKNGAYYLEESGCAVCLYRWVRLWRTGTL